MGLMAWWWFARRSAAVGLTGAVSGVGEDLQSRRFTGEQRHAGGPISGIGGSEPRRGDQAGLGFDRQVRLVAVGSIPRRLAGVAGLRVDGRDHPIRCHPLRDPPATLPLAGFDVLARHQRQDPHRVVLFTRERDRFERHEERGGVVDQTRDQLGLR